MNMWSEVKYRNASHLKISYLVFLNVCRLSVILSILQRRRAELSTLTTTKTLLTSKSFLTARTTTMIGETTTIKTTKLTSL